MRFRLLSALFLSFILACAHAQAPSPDTTSPLNNGEPGGFPQGGVRGFGGMGIPGSRGVMGTVTEVATDHFVVKTEDGQTLTVRFSVNTRIMKQAAGMRRGERRRGGGSGPGGSLPEPIKATEIVVGDAIGAMGEMDRSAKSIGAVAIVQLDPETAKRLAEMRANYGKTWIQGKVTAIDGVKVTLLGAVDNTAHSFVADENTTFRKRREPITLADIAIGDMVRADGALKDGIFTATMVSVMGMPPNGSPGRLRNGPTPQ